MLGFLGGLLAGGLLLVTIKAFPLYAGFVFNIVKQLIDFSPLPQRIFWQLLITGTVIGLFSSFISYKVHETHPEIKTVSREEKREAFVVSFREQLGTTMLGKKGTIFSYRTVNAYGLNWIF